MADISKIVLGGSTGVELDIKDATARESIETIETDLAGKADAATTLSGYGITDAYTQTEVDTLLSAKQDVLTFDNEPTEDSTNPVTSGGVYSQISDLDSELSTLDTDIQNIYVANGVLGAKNLLSFDEDFSYTVPSGGGEAFGVAPGTEINALDSGDYIFSFNATASAQALLAFYDSTETKIYGSSAFGVSSGTNSVEFTLPSTATSIKLYVNTANTITKCMIRLATDSDDTYQPYAMTNQEITDIVNCPSDTDGTYTLQAVVSSGAVTYSWVASS